MAKDCADTPARIFRRRERKDGDEKKRLWHCQLGVLTGGVPGLFSAPARHLPRIHQLGPGPSHRALPNNPHFNYRPLSSFSLSS